MELRLLSAADLRLALPMHAAIDAAEEAYLAQSSGQADTPPRLALSTEDGVTLVMPGATGEHPLATKLVSVHPGNAAAGRPTIHGIVTLVDRSTGVPLAVLEGTFLTSRRTGAAAGLAARTLAPGRSRAAILGTGPVAREAHLALAEVLDLDQVTVWSRDPDKASSFASGIGARAAASPGEAVEDAEVIITATPATTPLFEVDALAADALVVSVGSFTPKMQEVPPELARDAAIYVDDTDAALEEAGELLVAQAMGLTQPEDWVPLGAVLRGTAAPQLEGRRWFKSVGLAVQDVTAGGRAFEAAVAADLGQLVTL